MSRACLLALVLAVLSGLGVAPARATPVVSCSIDPTGDPHGADLGGRFTYHVQATGDGPLTVESTLLVLGDDATVLQEIPVEDGDVFQFQIRDQILVIERMNRVSWMVEAPGVLFRARAREAYETAVAYCSPFAAIRVDQPENLSFGATPSSPDAPVRLTIGFAKMIPSSIRISIDCVDILALTGAVIPGGPFSGNGTIAGVNVQVTDFVSDVGHGTISFTVLGLPGGGHKVAVSGTPTYEAELPPGHVFWERPLGALHHEATISIFRADIVAPANAAALPLAAVTVQGVLTHGRAITGLRVHGASTALPAEQFTPATECLGEIHRIEFTTQVPVADLRRDFLTGDDGTSTLDPGANFLSIIANDGGGTTAGDRVRFTLGDVSAPAVAHVHGGGAGVDSEPCPEGCGPVAEVPGHVSNGFAASLSERAVNQSVRDRILPLLQIQMNSSLNSFEGRSLESIVNACPGDAPGLILVPATPATPPSAPTSTSTSTPTSTSLERGRDRLLEAGNTPPVFDPPIQATYEVERTKELVIDLAATDADKDFVTFSLGQHPEHSDLINTRFAFTPTCDQLGTFTVEFIADDGTAQTMASTQITVVDGNEDIPLNPVVDNVIFDSSTMTMSVTFPDPNTIRVGIDTGPLTLEMSIDECYVDCLLCCCCGVEVDFTVNVPNIHVDADFTPQQLACGLAEGEEVAVTADAAPAQVDFGDPHFGCLSCFADLLFPGTTFFLEFLNLFDAQQSALDEFLAPVVESEVNDKLKDAIEDEFQERAGDLAGLLQFEPSTTLPPEVPLALSLCSARVPVITTNGSLTLGIHSDFDPVGAVDPEPPWVPTPSAFTGVETLGGDVALEVSDDAVNQLFSALAATGQLRQQFSGITLGTLAPSIDPTALALLEAIGLGPDTPLLLTADLAQNPDGDAIPPILGLVDDSTTPELEVKVRAQLLVRAIAERGETVGDDRDVCSCMDFSCTGEPCLLSESVLKLNFLVDVNLTGGPPEDTRLQFVITEIQQLAREEGFDAMETVDLASTEDDIVSTSVDSPLLELLRNALNTRLPPVDVPADAITLQGFVSPVNLRLFSRQVDDAGLGIQDYAGIVGDIVPTAPPLAVSRETPSSTMRAPRDGKPGKGTTTAVAGSNVPSPSADLGPVALTPASASITSLPNPFRGQTTFRMTVPRPSPYAVVLHDVRGNVVRRLSGNAPAGLHETIWDGTDDGGRVLPAGVYYYRVEGAFGPLQGRVVMIR